MIINESEATGFVNKVENTSILAVVTVLLVVGVVKFICEPVKRQQEKAMK